MIRALNLLLLLGLWAASLWAWPRLPDPMPTHFGLDGRADAWATPSLGRWLLVPLVAAGAIILLLAVRSWMARHPRHVNVFGKRLDEIPEDRQPRVLRAAQGLLDLVTTETTLILCLVQWATWRGAAGESAQAPLLLVLILSVVASPFLLIVFVTRVQGALSSTAKLQDEASA